MFVYIFCKVLKGLAVFFLLLFSSLSEDSWIYCTYFFLYVWHPALRLPFNRKLHQAMGGFKLSFIVCFKKKLRKRTGAGGGFLLLLSCALVNFVHGNHTGAF